MSNLVGGIAPMDNHTTVSLAQFCIAQHIAFNSNDWYVRFDTDGEAVALAVKHLLMTSWYGHEEELKCIDSRINVVVSNRNSLYLESIMIGFDLPHFSSKVHHEITQTLIDQETYA
jgi:hypothetical protein